MFLVLMDQRSKWLMTRLPLPRMQQACEFVGSDGAFSELSFVAEASGDACVALCICIIVLEISWTSQLSHSFDDTGFSIFFRKHLLQSNNISQQTEEEFTIQVRWMVHVHPWSLSTLGHKILPLRDSTSLANQMLQPRCIHYGHRSPDFLLPLTWVKAHVVAAFTLMKPMLRGCLKYRGATCCSAATSDNSAVLVRQSLCFVFGGVVMVWWWNCHERPRGSIYHYILRTPHCLESNGYVDRNWKSWT